MSVVRTPEKQYPGSLKKIQKLRTLPSGSIFYVSGYECFTKTFAGKLYYAPTSKAARNCREPIENLVLINSKEILLPR